MSHLSFMTSCLRKHLVPKGLSVRVTSLAPQIGCLERKLQRKWEITLKRMSCMLLKHLQIYHRDAVNILNRKINLMEARLGTEDNFIGELKRIQRSTQKWSTAYEKWKEAEMSRLTGNKPVRGRRPHQKRDLIIGKEVRRQATIPTLRWSTSGTYPFQTMRKLCYQGAFRFGLHHHVLTYSN